MEADPDQRKKQNPDTNKHQIQNSRAVEAQNVAIEG
jgi:hypothetical protein